MSRRALLCLLALSIWLCSSSCTTTKRLKTNALDFLYPSGTEGVPPTDVRLELPVRVGVAFAPAVPGKNETFTANQKEALLTRIAEAFKDREEINTVEVIPSSYLSPQGGFENLDRLATAFGIDLMALISYDQVQFSETGRSSWTYWTLVGIYVVKGEKNETRTMLDAVVYDIPSRAMLFHAAGQSAGEGRSTPIDMERDLRKRSAAGFEEATDDLIVSLSTALDAFREQAATGTVRGAGTPAVAIYDESGQQVSGEGGGGGGAGAYGLHELVAAGLLLSIGLLARRRNDR